MRIKMKNAAGRSYDVLQSSANTFSVQIDGNEFTISIADDTEDEINISRFSEWQKNELTKAIFQNESVLKQLDASNLESDDELITDKDEFMRVVNEVRNAK